MFQTVFGFLIEVFTSLMELLSWIKGLFLSFRSKYGPRTAIGHDYSWRNDAKSHRPPAPIQKFDGADRGNKGEQILSVAYGPFYRSWDKEMWKILKEKSWNLVLKTSNKNEEETLADYISAIKKVEDESRDLYGRDESIDLLSSHDFIMMMIYDGCFFLQVALSVLGGFKKLHHLRDFQLLIPGSNEKTTTMIKVAVSSMFVIGNQIPFLILKELMRQDFFRGFVRQGIWEEPSDMERWVLYELLLVPMFRGGERIGTIIQTNSLLNFLLQKRKSFWPLMPRLGLQAAGRESIGFRRNKHPSQKATDIIHGCWLLLTGFDDSEGDVYMDVDKDGSDRGYSAIPDCHSSYKFVPPTVRSATELKQAGVDFRYKGRTRINGIWFRNNMFKATLFLPRIIMVSENEMYTFFCNMIRYEATHFGESRRKMCEYLQLMCGLVRSEDDAKVLMADGIIVVHPDVPEDKVLGFFKQLNEIPYLKRHRNLMQSVKDDLNSYTKPSPFKKLGDVLNFVVFLTFLQTLMAFISYFLPRTS